VAKVLKGIDAMAVIPVDIAGRPYEVRVGTGLLAELVAQCRGKLRKRRVPIVTDANVHAAWGAVVENALRQGGHEAALAHPARRAKRPRAGTSSPPRSTGCSPGSGARRPRIWRWAAG
jgi:hypothetical protein